MPNSNNANNRKAQSALTNYRNYLNKREDYINVATSQVSEYHKAKANGRHRRLPNNHKSNDTHVNELNKEISRLRLLLREKQHNYESQIQRLQSDLKDIEKQYRDSSYQVINLRKSEKIWQNKYNDIYSKLLHNIPSPNENSVYNEETKLNKENQSIQQLEIKKCNQEMDKMGIKHENRYIFNHSSLRTIINAIQNKIEIENINIYKATKDPNFRFYSKDFPRLSLDISNLLASMAKSTRQPLPEFMEKGRKKRSENADIFAIEIHSIIKKVKEEEKIDSYLETAKALNERGIETYSKKGKWQTRTLLDLNERWEKLGLDPIRPRQK